VFDEKKTENRFAAWEPIAGGRAAWEVANSCYLMAQKWNLQHGTTAYILSGEQFWGRAVRCVL